MPAEIPAASPAAASPTPADADAELVSPTTDKPSGWTRLPLELREKIVDSVPQVIEDVRPDRETLALEAVAVGFFAAKSALDDHVRSLPLRGSCSVPRR